MKLIQFSIHKTNRKLRSLIYFLNVTREIATKWKFILMAQIFSARQISFPNPNFSCRQMEFPLANIEVFWRGMRHWMKATNYLTLKHISTFSQQASNPLPFRYAFSVTRLRKYVQLGDDEEFACFGPELNWLFLSISRMCFCCAALPERSSLKCTKHFLKTANFKSS